MDDSRIELSFDNLLRDQLAADRLYYKSTLFWKLDKVVAVAMVGMGAYLVWGAGVRWWTLIWFPLAVAEWFNLLSLRPLQVWYWFTHNPKFSETYYLAMDGNGIVFRTKSIDSRLQWSHFTRFLENGKVCLLVYGTRMYSVIPKRVFKNDAELARFRALVQRNVGGSRHGA